MSILFPFFKHKITLQGLVMQKLHKKLEDQFLQDKSSISFQLSEGPLLNRLMNLYQDNVYFDEIHEQIDDELNLDEFVLIVTLSQESSSSDVNIKFDITKIDSNEMNYSSGIYRKQLTENELADLVQQINYHISKSEQEHFVPSNNKVLRRKKKTRKLYRVNEASKKLRVSPDWLKLSLPCSESDNLSKKKDAHKHLEYYWSKKLINQLYVIKTASKVKKEYYDYVSKECCFGDIQWAKDIISELRKMR
jgi:hypothetical protein